MTNRAATPVAPTTVNEAVINPKTGRPAGPLQGTLLLIGSCLPILGAVLLAPILPTVSTVFKNSAGSAALVPLILTIPALFIAILAPFAGAIVDKVGRKRVLILALLVYAVVGTAPLYLNSLGAIIASRAGVGITEAFIMTCCTTMIADYFTGNRRNKYLSLQALVTALAATVFFAIGGAVGAFGWRTPFWLYVVSILVAIVMIGAIWPTNATEDGQEKKVAKLAPVPWSKLVLPTLVAFFGGIVFYTLIVELPYVLAGEGVTATAIIGAVTAVASLVTAIGAFTFRYIAKRGVGILLPLALVLAGVGQLIVGFAPIVPVIIIGAVIAGFGTGILLPTMVTWSIARLGYEQRGRGTGLFTGAMFLGEFVTPLVVLALTAAAGSLGGAIAIVGGVAVVVCIVLAIVVRRFPQPSLIVTN
ncbi:MAG TPA: MFS transporter [Microbacteriaceae bacterium]